MGPLILLALMSCYWNILQINPNKKPFLWKFQFCFHFCFINVFFLVPLWVQLNFQIIIICFNTSFFCERLLTIENLKSINVFHYYNNIVFSFFHNEWSFSFVALKYIANLDWNAKDDYSLEHMNWNIQSNENIK